jgi:hypothetical protein
LVNTECMAVLFTGIRETACCALLWGQIIAIF